jgi:hypothetical protein
VVLGRVWTSGLDAVIRACVEAGKSWKEISVDSGPHCRCDEGARGEAGFESLRSGRAVEGGRGCDASGGGRGGRAVEADRGETARMQLVEGEASGGLKVESARS